MDISFDIENRKGDRLRVALSFYDTDAIRVFSSDPETLSLKFFDVTLIRIAGDGYAGMRSLNAVSEILGRFLDENDDAVLCFYCDDTTDIIRNHNDLSPQEYRSKLFSRMFDKYSGSRHNNTYINRTIRFIIEDHCRFTHFICRPEHQEAVDILGEVLLNK